MTAADGATSATAARRRLRAWLAEHPSPTGAELAAAGYVAPHWPEPYGIGADPDAQLVVDEELAAAGVSIPENQIGIGWAGPTLLVAGTPEQQARLLPPMLDGSEFWCQLFSEPGAGSDLSALSTSAVLDGDTWVVTGQKVWSTWADRSRWGILLARTDPDLPQHRGISYFVCPMDDPGIDVRPIREMSGGHHFNEVFLDEVRIPADLMIGRRGDGWKLANVTLGNERVALSTGGICWGMGPTSGDFVDLVRDRGGIADPIDRQRFASVATEAFVLDVLGRRMLDDAVAGRTPGPEASMKKFLADVHGQHLTELATDLTGASAMLAGDDAVGPLGAEPGEWPWAFLFARALTVGGGTSQVQRNILAERVLGLPRGSVVTMSDDTTGPEQVELLDGIMTTRAMRRFTDEPVAEADLAAVLAAAQQAPSGGNIQPWHFVVVVDPELRRQLGDLYLRAYDRYEAALLPTVGPHRSEDDAASWERTTAASRHLAEHFGEVPVVVAVCMPDIDLTLTDDDGPLDIGGLTASVFPAVQNMMLAARSLGLGSALTTVFRIHHDEVRDVLGVPAHQQVVALVPIGHPVGRFGVARRRPVETVTSWDTWGNRRPRAT